VQVLQLCMVLVLWIWRLSLLCALPLEKERSTCLELLMQLAARVYLLILVWLSEIILPKIKGAPEWLCAYGWVTIL
jgi:hypothetical protein